MWTETLIFACLAIAVLCLYIRVQLLAVFRRVPWLEVPSELPAEKPRITVIIPARNEELDLERALRSVLAQEGVELEVILVNDHSTDRTGAIADEIARSDSRVRVLHDPVLSEGWFGKANAMQQASRLATHDLLLFTDADIMHHPRCFAAGHAELRRREADFLTLLPEFRPCTFWEQTLLPAMAGALVQFLPPGMNESDSPQALAAGAFMLVNRQAFEAVGGFESIRQAISDDVALAQLLKSHRHRVVFEFAPRLLSVTMFKTNRDAFWSATKNVLIAVEGIRWLNGPLMVLAVPLFLVPVLVFWTPPLAFATGLKLGHPTLIIVSMIAWLSQAASIQPMHRVYRMKWATWAGFPLVALPLACCAFKALYYRWVRGSVLWRGRVVKVGSASNEESPAD